VLILNQKCQNNSRWSPPAVSTSNIRKRRVRSYSRHKRVGKAKTSRKLRSSRRRIERQLKVKKSKRRSSMMRKLKLKLITLKNHKIFVMVMKPTFIIITTIKLSTNTKCSIKAHHHNSHNHTRIIAKHVKKRD